MNNPAAAAVAQAMNSQTIRDQQRTIRELESKLAIALNNLQRANDATADEHARAEAVTARLTALRYEVVSASRDLTHRDVQDVALVDRVNKRLSEALASQDSRITEGH